MLFNRTLASHHAAFNHFKLKAMISVRGISIKHHTARCSLVANLLTYSLGLCAEARVSPGSRCRLGLGGGREERREKGRGQNSPFSRTADAAQAV